MNNCSYTLTNYQLHEILKRFYDKFYLRKKGNSIIKKINPNKLPLMENLSFIKAYKSYCSYTGEKEYIYKKYHIIIKYKISNLSNDGLVCLNILYDDYKDFFDSRFPSIK